MKSEYPNQKKYPLHFKYHAAERMLERNIHPNQAENVLRQGKLLRRYPDDNPKSYLVHGKVRSPEHIEEPGDPSGLPPEDTDDNLLRPVHVVATNSDRAGITTVITVYVADEDKWEDDYRWKKSWSTTQNTWREQNDKRTSVSERP